jgi:hypothetical protein
MKNQKNQKAFRLSLAAGLLIVGNAASLGIVARCFPTIMPMLPGSTVNDPQVLYSLSILGLVLGVLVLIGTLMLKIKPTHSKVGGLMIIVFSAFSVITGGGFIIGFLLGILGGRTSLIQEK